MKNNAAINNLLHSYIDAFRIAGAALIVRKNGQIVCDTQAGWADIERKIPMDKHTILRLASMTKPMVAIAVMQLAEKKLLSIDDPIGKYLPDFSQMKAAALLVGFTDYYEADPNNPAMPKAKPELLEGIRLVDAVRQVTIRDLLTHSSGMGQGPFSMTRYDQLIKPGQSLEERVHLISTLPLDFQPGTMTGYSANVAFDVLGRLVELLSGENLAAYMTQHICVPLGCGDLSFVLNEAQKQRIARLYEGTASGFRDVTDEEPFWQLVSPLNTGYYSGSAGMLGTVADYDRVVQMLSSGGILNGCRILKEETVHSICEEGALQHLEVCPGMRWGLGMVVSEASEKMGRSVGKNTFGWSGAYGTHFYIDPENRITAVLGVNASNIGGADSPLSRELENVIFQEFC